MKFNMIPSPSIWPELRELDLRDLELESFWTRWAALPNMEYLSIRSNRIPGIYGFPRCPRLKIFDAGNNRIRSLLLPKMESLIRLNLAGNHLTSLHWFELSGPFPHLHRLKVSGNPIKTLADVSPIGRMQILPLLRPIDLNGWTLCEKERKVITAVLQNPTNQKSRQIINLYYKKFDQSIIAEKHRIYSLSAQNQHSPKKVKNNLFENSNKI